jgi:hypothetical protein
MGKRNELPVETAEYSKRQSAGRRCLDSIPDKLDNYPLLVSRINATEGLMSRANKLLLLAALLLLGLFMTSCGGGGDEDDLTTPPDREDPLPDQLVPEVQVQIVDNLYRIASWSDEVLDRDPIFSIIGSANTSLDIAATRINRQEVVDALLQEARSGTVIRIVTEKGYYDMDSYRPFYAQLEDPTLNGGNIQIRTDNEGFPRMMHARFLVIDHARVVTGSYNWETADAEKTFGDVITILDTGVAQAFTNQFNQMFVEGNFGVHKRNDTQHSFLLGGGNGMLEVYFGPTDQPRELLTEEITQSNAVVFAVQQFKDLAFANTMLGWANGNANSYLIAMFNDFGAQGDAEENAVYDAFLQLSTGEADFSGGEIHVNTEIDPDGQFNGYNTMNHKLLFADHAMGDGQMSMTFYTGNYSDLAFTLNDEIMLIFRGYPLVSKYWRFLDFTSSLPPATVQTSSDIQEIDELLAMWPFSSSEGSELLRDFSDVPCGIVWGSVDNFKPEVTLQEEGTGGDPTEVEIDILWEMEGTLFFSDGTFGPVQPMVYDDMYVRSEMANPDHRFLLVVPAGEVTLRAIVAVDGEGSGMFEPDEETFYIAPGGVREITMKVNQSQSQGDTGGGNLGG